MATDPTALQTVGHAGENLPLRWRVLDPVDKVLAVQADFTSITCRIVNITDEDNPVVVAASRSLTIADVVFDTAEKDGTFVDDAEGYNGAYDVPASDFAADAAKYMITLTQTFVGGYVLKLTFEHETVTAW